MDQIQDLWTKYRTLGPNTGLVDCIQDLWTTYRTRGLHIGLVDYIQDSWTKYRTRGLHTGLVDYMQDSWTTYRTCVSQCLAKDQKCVVYSCVCIQHMTVKIKQNEWWRTNSQKHDGMIWSHLYDRNNWNGMVQMCQTCRRVNYFLFSH